MFEPLLSDGSDSTGPGASIESTLLRRISSAPAEAGLGVIVLTSRNSLLRLRDLAAHLEGTMTLIVVMPPRGTDPTSHDADEYVERLARPLPNAPLHTVIGHSAAGYIAAKLATARARHQPRRPKLVMLEPPTPNDLMSDPLSGLFLLPEPALQRFTESLDTGCLVTAPQGTPEFRRQVMQAVLTHRAELDAALRSVDPTQLLAPPPSAVDVYTDWVGLMSLCMQLANVTYDGPTVSIEGLYTANMEPREREQKFARLRASFPHVFFQETTHMHGDLLSDAVLHPHLAPPHSDPAG
jgi:pimeloyl-ACP methyl ester carboxylesterase